MAEKNETTPEELEDFADILTSEGDYIRAMQCFQAAASIAYENGDMDSAKYYQEEAVNRLEMFVDNPGLDSITDEKVLVVLERHNDDAVIYLGGTILDESRPVIVITIPPEIDADAKFKFQIENYDALKTLGVKIVLPDLSGYSPSDTAKIISSVFPHADFSVPLGRR